MPIGIVVLIALNAFRNALNICYLLHLQHVILLSKTASGYVEQATNPCLIS